MFTDADWVKLSKKPGVSFKSLIQFLPDKRLTNPIAIIDDPCMRFGEYEKYPTELAKVIYYNGA